MFQPFNLWTCSWVSSKLAVTKLASYLKLLRIYILKGGPKLARKGPVLAAKSGLTGPILAADQFFHYRLTICHKINQDYIMLPASFRWQYFGTKLWPIRSTSVSLTSSCRLHVPFCVCPPVPNRINRDKFNKRKQHMINTQINHIGCNVAPKSFHLHEASRQHNEINFISWHMLSQASWVGY